MPEIPVMGTVFGRTDWPMSLITAHSFRASFTYLPLKTDYTLPWLFHLLSLCQRFLNGTSIPDLSEFGILVSNPTCLIWNLFFLLVMTLLFYILLNFCICRYLSQAALSKLACLSDTRVCWFYCLFTLTIILFSACPLLIPSFRFSLSLTCSFITLSCL